LNELIYLYLLKSVNLFQDGTLYFRPNGLPTEWLKTAAQPHPKATILIKSNIC